jgi:hypothetical protein
VLQAWIWKKTNWGFKSRWQKDREEKEITAK